MAVLTAFPRLAAAPVSWGVWRPSDKGHPLRDEFLSHASDLGFSGVELGPAGFLGPEDPDTVARLRAAELGCAGCFVEVALLDRPSHSDSFIRSVQALSHLGPGAVLVVADLGSPELQATAGKLAPNRLSAPLESLRSAVRELRAMHRVCEQSGIGFAFHPHMGTMFQTKADVSVILEHPDASELAICLDTGHCYMGGIDPVAFTRTLGNRLAHVHLKDVDSTIYDQVAHGSMAYDQAWAAGMFCRLGDGSAAIEEVSALLASQRFAGWIVSESDRFESSSSDLAAIVAAEGENLRRIRAWLDGPKIRAETRTK